jgi:hypothetical protein
MRNGASQVHTALPTLLLCWSRCIEHVLPSSEPLDRDSRVLHTFRAVCRDGMLTEQVEPNRNRQVFIVESTWSSGRGGREQLNPHCCEIHPTFPTTLITVI